MAQKFRGFERGTPSSVTSSSLLARRLSPVPCMIIAAPAYFGVTCRVVQICMRIPLILISHSGGSRSPIPVILITLFTMPEEGTADSMTWRWTVTTDG
jgi:hypothetical protein